MTETTITYCANHPRVETHLRCNRCEKPICVKCAVQTPTGYRCHECVRGQQKIFETAHWYDYLLGFGISGFLSLIISLLISFVGGMLGYFSFFILFAAAPTAGIIIAEAVRWATGKRRAKRLFLVIAIGVALGALPLILAGLYILDVFSLIFQGIYLVMVVPTVYYRISGIQIFK
jgi:hypothetical protein